jgi:hypothetical protein
MVMNTIEGAPESEATRDAAVEATSTAEQAANLERAQKAAGNGALAGA